MIHTYEITEAGSSHVKRGIPCQDACNIVKKSDNFVIAAVADGVGSTKYADIASKIAAKISTEYCAEHITSSSTFDEICHVIKISFSLAQRTIEKKAKSSGHGIEQYDTTLTLAVVIHDTLYYGHCGDSGIIALTNEGLYEQVTEQQRDEDDCVFPLFREDMWVFKQYEKKVSSVLLATDGLLEVFFPMCIKNDPVPIYVNLARFFMDKRDLRIDELGVDAVQSSREQYIHNISDNVVDDDKTLVVLVNSTVDVLDPEEYANLPDLEERERIWQENLKRKLYPHLFSDKISEAVNESNSVANDEHTCDSNESVLPE